MSNTTWAAVDYLSGMTVDFKTKLNESIGIILKKDPEKSRKILNLLLVPDFKPVFYDDAPQHTGLSGSTLDDVELLDAAYSSTITEPGGEEGRYPIRMIDLDTKNFVNYPEIGDRGQYCILSHSWKGREIDYKYLTDAYYMDINQRLSATDKNATSNGLNSANDFQRSQIEIAKQKCKDDIAKQEARINSFAHDEKVMNMLQLDGSTDLIEELLSRRIKVQIVEKDFKDADKKLRKALVAQENRVLEDRVFEDVFAKIGLEKDEIKRIIGDENATKKASEAEVKAAKEYLYEVESRRSDELQHIELFKSFSHVRETMDDLINYLQRYKSMMKIEGVARTAKNIFDNNAFPKAEKKYLWIDSCCIDKSDGGEYVRSMASMGEWYKNAEFCLVHLDTPRDVPSDALDDWKMLKSNTVPSKPNIEAFENIFNYKPEWSTRAWTLQELVMSKTTFYVNSLWQPLSRPVERLGRWYYFSPFLPLYTQLDKENIYSNVLDDDWKSNIEGIIAPLEDEVGKKQIQEESQDQLIGDINLAQRVIHILYALDVRIPTDIDLRSAIPAITRAVFAAVQSRDREGQYGNENAKKPLYYSLVEAFHPFASTREDYSQEKAAKHAINILLKSIVKLVGDPILEDRKEVARFGNVQDLETWKNGLGQSNFSAHKVMSLVCPRDAQVLSDRAYCLMGMLGVRFPVFPAEGLTKALSRLIDEVVTASNDVSVFNWTGKHHGSPIRGRSLYPTSPEAFRIDYDEAEKKVKMKRLSDILQIKRYDVLNDFNAIWKMLVEIQKFMKDRNQHDIPLSWVTEILLVMKRASFELLKPHIRNIGAILKYIQKNFDTTPEKTEDRASPASPSPRSTIFSTSFNPLPSQMKLSSLSKDITGFKPPKLGRKQSGQEATSPNWGIGGFKRPSLKSFGRTDSASSQSSKKPVSADDELADDSSSTSRPSTPSISEKRQSLEKEVLDYIKSIRRSNKQEVKLPAEIASALEDAPKKTSKQLGMKHPEMESLKSPNPIIITNSGIEGTFDIQRVIITFQDSEKLRRQVENAVNPNQKISGWCIISTGFAVTLVSFSCPKHILEKQLDVASTVEERIHDQDDIDEESEEDDATPKTGTPSQIEGKGSPNPPGIARKGKNQALKRFKKIMENSRIKKEPAKPGDEGDKEKGQGEGQEEDNTEDAETDGPQIEAAELKKVIRMINFVQDPELTSIAGEWVLARFSGVPGAKWFLCYLELGASKHDFHGHRIATDEIDFHKASPEPGLTKCWEKYMFWKKYKLCSVLQKLVEARDWDKTASENKQYIVDRMTEVVSDKINGAGGRYSGGSPDPDLDSDSSSEDENTVMDVGAAGLATFGASLFQKFYEMRSERAEAQLSAWVLNKFPRHIQAALKNLDDSKDLMPSMFHAAKKIHMF
ncbi:hypothetical protein F4775DRAFT_495937 [Biscogniauxia sp. FL1348]|nr:hypothetical protein F4775DRAFT_495937 [Biscogniauxia sp. FL1348]